MKALFVPLLIAGCGLLPNHDNNPRLSLLQGEWVQPPTQAHLDEPWERITFYEDGYLSQSTFNYFQARWNLIADSLSYELINNSLNLQQPDGSTITTELVTLTDSTLAYNYNDNVISWRRPQEGDPGY